MRLRDSTPFEPPESNDQAPANAKQSLELPHLAFTEVPV